MVKYLKLCVIFAFFLLTCINIFSETIEGVVDFVVNGDIITVETLKRGYQIRLFGVDAPELTQPYGEEAKNFLYSFTFNKPVTVKLLKKKGVNLYLGEVYVRGENLNRVMLEKGYAWYDRGEYRYSFKKLEDKSKKRKIGLWEDKKPIPPWMYREMMYLNSYIKEKIDPNETVYVTLRGNDFHKIECVHFSGPVTLYSVKEAEEMGYTPCPFCYH